MQQQQPINRMNKQNSQERNPIILNSEIDFSIYERSSCVGLNSISATLNEFWRDLVSRN